MSAPRSSPGYFKAAKPRSKVLILDANPDVTSKGPLFKKVWAEQYKGIVEYRGQHKATAVDVKAGIIKFDVQDDVKANVLNVLPVDARRHHRRAGGPATTRPTTAGAASTT